MRYLIVSIPDLCTLTYFGCGVLCLCFVVHYCVLSSFAIILKRKRELVALLCCLTDVLLLYMLWLFLMVLWVGLGCVIVVFPDHTHFLFYGLPTLLDVSGSYVWYRLPLACRWLKKFAGMTLEVRVTVKKNVILWVPGFPQKFKNTIPWFFHDQQCIFHDYLKHGLQPPPPFNGFFTMQSINAECRNSNVFK